jgi:hypothetical protein
MSWCIENIIAILWHNSVKRQGCLWLRGLGLGGLKNELVNYLHMPLSYQWGIQVGGTGIDQNLNESSGSHDFVAGLAIEGRPLDSQSHVFSIKLCSIHRYVSNQSMFIKYMLFSGLYKTLQGNAEDV